MKRNILFAVLSLFIAMTSCYDDLGNYTYTEPEDPIVTGLTDMEFEGIVGDSLIITPVIEHSLKGTDALSYEWNIYNHLDLRGEYYYGPSLRMLFNLKPDTYTTKFTITNHTNGMKYFYKFKIVGKTEFSTGTLILSEDNGVSRLSFIKADSTLQENIYEGLHGENLPDDPKQLLVVDHAWLKSYHVLTGEANKPGVIIDATTMFRVKNLEENFFDAPATIHARSIVLHPSGVSTGVINGKLYCGQWQTCPCSPVFGIFGAPAAGDYDLSQWFNFYGSHYLGFDLKQKRFVQFDINLLFQGSGYQVVPMGEGPMFDPKNLNVDLLYLQNLNPETTYAFGKDAGGVIYEYKFYDVPGVVFPKHMREFAGAGLVADDTKWAGSAFEIFYFTSGDKVYRYNPINEEVRLLDADLGGKTITMIKLIDDDLLIAGVEGSLYCLDVRIGKNGDVLNVVENIPGNPIDVVVRK